MKTISRSDPLDGLAAMRRAAKAALELAKRTGTPCYVMENGKIVNLNPAGRLRKPPRRLTLNRTA